MIMTLVLIVSFMVFFEMTKGHFLMSQRKDSQVLSIKQISSIAKWMAQPDPHHIWIYDLFAFESTYINDVPLDNCFAFNFGSSIRLDIPQINMRPYAMSKPISLPLKTSIPNHCFIVLIGQRYSLRLDEILYKMRFVAYYITRRPVLYMMEETQNFDVNLGKSPAMVKWSLKFMKMKLVFRFFYQSKIMILEQFFNSFVLSI